MPLPSSKKCGQVFHRLSRKLDSSRVRTGISGPREDGCRVAVPFTFLQDLGNINVSVSLGKGGVRKVSPL